MLRIISFKNGCINHRLLGKGKLIITTTLQKTIYLPFPTLAFNKMNRIYKGAADIVSAGLSLLCVIHCLLLPLFLTSVSLLGIELLENKPLEIIIILLSAIAGGYAVKRGYLPFHRNKSVLVLFLIGLASMIGGNFFPEEAEALLKGTGALLIIVSHIQNWKLSKTIHSNKRSGIAFAE
jgi:uncharacterized membrane protein YqjE